MLRYVVGALGLSNCFSRGHGSVHAHCKAYEIRGRDPTRTAGAVRCHRNADLKVTIDGRTFPLCAAHHEARWESFVQGVWLFVVDPKSEHPATPKTP